MEVICEDGGENLLHHEAGYTVFAVQLKTT